MLKQARLKLTGWYLLIIMMISLAFSGVIYRAATFEFNRFARAQQSRSDNRVLFVNDQVVQLRPALPPFDEDLINDAKSRLFTTLLLINLGILSCAALLGYYLSGKTLEPISKMMEEQYRFVSDASHELKTPLTAMKSTLEVALRDPNMKLKEAKKTLEVSLGEVNDLQKLAEGLLELSGNHGSDAVEKVNLSHIAQEAIKTLEPLSSSRKIAFVTTLPKVVILGEHETLKRAITTIIDNAIKYSKAKSNIYISAKTTGKTAVLVIRDEGIGIDAREIPLLFNRFYRSDKARSTDGHGLGLSIAKKIVESHKGVIKIESKKGKGTTVSLIFPYSA
jgi:two-component system sensor histidine kinase CiaH